MRYDVVLLLSGLGLCAVDRCIWVFLFFFFKQKTAYEMRISDWSSDVCSSDLQADFRDDRESDRPAEPNDLEKRIPVGPPHADGELVALEQIGRASCRERVCQYV